MTPLTPIANLLTVLIRSGSDVLNRNFVSRILHLQQSYKNLESRIRNPESRMANRSICLSLLILFFALSARAQFFPVQSTTQLLPPYSVYLSDYATPGEEKLRVILVQRDLTQPSYQLRLFMTVEWNGKVIMRTSRAFTPPPITLDAGLPFVISGADLAPYLDSRNIEFTGYSREQYERTKALPEGSYQICFTAYDYRRQDVQISNNGCTFYYLSKSEPPLLNFPACGDLITSRTPQQIVFSWLPRNTASPNSAANTYYEFALYETRPAGRNPNDVVLTTEPIFRTTTDFTQLVYGPAEPLLIEGLTYVWRVRSVDRNGKDAFRNNGYSEVCTFRLGPNPQFDIGVVRGFQAVAEAERKGRIWWDTGEFDSYRVYYKKSGKDYEWFTSDTKSTEIKVYDLEPDTEYETRIQARKNNAFGPFGEIIKFRTPPARIVQCGDATPLQPPAPGNPFLEAIKGTVVTARGMEITLNEIESAGQDGWYKGTGRVTVNYLAGASFAVKFDRIFINEERNVTHGRIDFVTQGVAAMMNEQLADQKQRQLDRQQEENREQWKDTQFHDKIFFYGDLSIDTVTADASGNIVVTDENGITYVNTEIAPLISNAPEKAVIIEDKNGDQWVVQKDQATGETKVTKVEGGGLSPNGNSPVTAEATQIVKKALRRLRIEYHNERIAQSQSELNAKKADLQRTIATNNRSLGIHVATTASPDAESFLFDFEQVTDEVVQETSSSFARLSKEVKTLELEYNRLTVIRILADGMDSKDDYKFIARELIINGEAVSSFVTEQKAANAKEEDIVAVVSGEIVKLIDQVIINYSAQTK